RECDWGRKSSQIRAGGLHLSKICVQEFTLDGPMLVQFDFRAATTCPALSDLVNTGVLVRCGKGVSEQGLIVEVGRGQADCAVEEHRAVSNANAWTNGN